jgi:Potato inhibitor I family/Stress responsive A/B Barrel Domain
VVLMRLPDDASDEARSRLEKALSGIAALRLPGQLEVRVGLDAGVRAGGWSAAIVNDWADETSYRGYDADPGHRHWRAQIEEVCAEVARVQFTFADDTLRPGSEAAALARTLVGLTGDDAVARATAGGFDPDLVPPGTTAVTMDFRPRRIRLFVDDHGRVERATGG